MRKLFILLASFAFAYTSNAQQSEKRVGSAIKAVTVFLNRAQVTNTAQIYLTSGTTNLVFEDLSTKIDRQSIQVTAKGSITIMSVKHQINYLRNQYKALAIKQLEDSVIYYSDLIRYSTAQKTVLQREEEMILANKSIGGDGVGVNAQKLKEVADYFRTRLTEIQMGLIKTDRELADQNTKITRLRNQISVLNANANKPTSEILVTVTATSPTTADFELDYIVPDAGWTPTYDLRAKDAQSPIQLSYKANVYQNTGVDWKDVKVTLSTGNPNQSGIKPELSTWYVDIFNPIAYEKVAERNRGLYNNAKNKMRSPTSDMKKTEEVAIEKDEALSIADQTVVSTSSFATEFEISVPYTILSDGKSQLVDIKNYEMKTNYEYSVVPRKDYDAFLMARMTGWEEYNLLSGAANVYFEGTFVGETFLDAANIKDTLSISLGRDKKIIVKRFKIQDFSSKKFIGANTKEELGFEIQIRNTKKENIIITIEDQYPISKNSQIEITLIEAKDAQINVSTGKLLWKLNMKPNEMQKLITKYSIKYPKNKQITFE